MRQRLLSSPSGWAGIVLLLLAGCGQSSPKDPFELPAADKQAYRMDCQAFCQAEAACRSVPEDSDCRAVCAGLVDKGAVQSAYLDTRFDCVSGLPSDCDQGLLDDCWAQALAACQPADGLADLLEAWCRRWLSCNGSPVEPYLQRCLDDFAATPDRALFDCFSQPALDSLGRCLEAASCQQVVDLPLLKTCVGVYQ